MSLRRVAVVSVTMALLGMTPTWAAAASQPPAAGVSGHQTGVRGHRLSPELKMMWRKEVRSQLKALPREQRRGWFRTQWASMTDAQREAKVAELQAKWDALPSDVRQTLLERKRQRHERRWMRKQANYESGQGASAPATEKAPAPPH